jgi:hypothetical protein
MMELKTSPDSSVGIETGYGLDGRVSIPGQGKYFSVFSTAFRQALRSIQHPIQWVRGEISPGVKVATHLHLVLRSRMVELYLHSPICLHGIVLNYLSRGTFLPFI